jgi:glycosidase
MVWDDLTYEPEVTHPLGGTRRANRVEPDASLRETYQRLIELRKDHLRLFADGDLTWLMESDGNYVVAYGRDLEDQHAIVAFNASEDFQDLEIPARDGAWQTAYAPGPRAEGESEVTDVAGGMLPARLAPMSAQVWILMPAGER